MTPRPLHIGYLNQDFPPEVGAGPARILEMSRRWQAQGARVTVVAGMPNRRIPGRGEGAIDPRYAGKWFVEEDWEGIRTLRSWVFTGNGRGFRNKLLNTASFMATGFLHGLLRAERFDVLIASSPPFPAHLAGVALSALGRAPLVLEIRDLWPDYMVEMGLLNGPRSRRALFAIERWALGSADHVVVVTDSFRERVIAKGVSRERTDVIPNGVDLDLYYHAEEPPPIPELGRGPGAFNVGYLGTFGRGQDLAAVARAAHLVAGVQPTIRFVLVGDGPENATLEAELHGGHAANISIRPPIERARTRAFYNACDVCLVPLAALRIFQETVPSKMFEIMACERPLVASLAGEGAAIVTASGGGILALPGDPRSLADVILRLHATPEEERRAMGARGRAYVAEHYSRAALADRYLGILARVAARGKGKGITSRR